MLKGRTVLGKPTTTLDPRAYRLSEAGAIVKLFDGNINELVPAIIRGKAELALLDVPDALMALEKWAGRIKVIGPVSPLQAMGVAFRKDSPQLRQEFDRFFVRLKGDGTYAKLVQKYFPAVLETHPDFFRDAGTVRDERGEGSIQSGRQ
jgi:ABC-type amino acid transport substrate-binding protein